MAIDEQTQHVALPKLMGQPAYARPPRYAEVTAPRPLDPDDLPLEIYLDGAELEHARELRSRPFLAVPVVDSAAEVRSSASTKPRGLGRPLSFLFRGSDRRT